MLSGSINGDLCGEVLFYFTTSSRDPHTGFIDTPGRREADYGVRILRIE